MSRPSAFVLLLLVACERGPGPMGPDAGDPGVGLAPSPETPDLPLAGASVAQQRAFRAGDAVFDQLFEAPDGLGPVYVQPSCAACHLRGGRGPGQTRRMAVVSASTGERVESLPFGALVRPLVTAGAGTPVLPPDGLPEGSVLLVTNRLAAPVFGRAHLEAIADSEIERVAAEQALRADGIHGRVNRVAFQSQGTVDPQFPAHASGEAGLIGRFGVKARLATLDDVVADALQGDLGLTSALRPAELPNPDGLTDDLLPGVDLPDMQLAALVEYTRLLDIPRRPGPDPRGAALFESVGCAVCHVPSLRTRADWPTLQLAGIDAPVFTDLLLHDMGAGLADGQQEGGAGPSDFRTAPLVGLRYLAAYLHDGRATTLREAVLDHGAPGSEAAGTVQRFVALTPEDQDALLAFLGGL
ncbi:MAG TPA: di-heme oxidoredictase family protein [Myxococcaceae bacterium]|nr:di-heme oxidoredictase family protein [Myxococcaceae bacterium]